MTYFWRYETSEGIARPGPEERFDDQQAAEEWLSTNFGDLADQGIDQVTLMSDDEIVYGPMSLHAP